MRLDKYIASVTDLSRKQVKAAVRQKLVRVDGTVSNDPSVHISESSEVSLEGEILNQPGFRYLMLHKPEGVVCATRDSHQATVIDLLELPRLESLQIAGRLDRDTTGLVLITDDGQWNHALTSPRRRCEKVYRVGTAQDLDEGLVEAFERGMVLQPENKRTRPARLNIMQPRVAEVRLVEGRYHQVKRMFAMHGVEVVTLHRSAIGAITLDPALLPGHYRKLQQSEVQSIIDA